MGEASNTGVIALVVGTIAAIPTGGFGVVIRRLYGRVARTVERVDRFADDLEKEARAREKADDKLSKTLSKMSDQLHERIDESTKATNKLNTTTAVLAERIKGMNKR